MATQPGTLTFSTDTVGGGSLGVSAAAPDVSVRGAGVGTTSPVRSGADWFESTGMVMPDGNLPEFLNEVTAESAAKLKQQRMWDGFVAARAGQTMQEIDEETPWYSNLFGPTNYEIGATTYNTLRSVSDMEQDLLHRMPELRQLPPEAMAQEFNSLAQARMTGNTYADALLQKTFMDRAGPLMDLHTKERVAWQQAELVKANYAAGSSAATSYNQLATANARLGKDRPMQPEEAERMTQAELNLLDTVTPSMYQTDPSIKANAVNLIKGMADRNELHSLNLFLKKGVLDHLDPDDGLQLREYIRQAEVRGRTRYIEQNPKVQNKMFEVGLYASNGIGGQPIDVMVNEMNAEYMANTGSTVGLYDANDRIALISRGTLGHIQAQESALRSQATADKTALTEMQKQQGLAETQRGALMAWGHGQYGNARAASAGDKETMDSTVEQQFYQTLQTNPALALGQLVQNHQVPGGVIERYKDKLQLDAQNLLLEQPSDASFQMFKGWQAMKNTQAMALDANGNVTTRKLSGVGAAMKYYGNTTSDLFNRIEQLTANGTTDWSVAYKMARDAVLSDDPTLSAESRKATEQLTSRVSGVIQNMNPSVDLGMLGSYGNQLSKTSQDAAARSLAHVIRDSKGMLPTTKEGLREAYNIARSTRGAETAGKYYWENGRDNQGSVFPRIGAALGNAHDNVTGPSIESAIDKTLKLHNVQSSETADLGVRVFRMGDMETGNPVLYVQVGQRKVYEVPFSEIQKEYEKKRNEAVRAASPVPQGYVRMPDGTIAPSITPQPKL